MCNYTNPHHTKGITDLINAYIIDDMGGGEPLSESLQFFTSISYHLSRRAAVGQTPPFTVEDGNNFFLK